MKVIQAVSVAIWKNDRVLLARRGRDPAKGLWSLPGGKVKAGELVEQAARREIFEETGLTLDHLEYADVNRVVRSQDNPPRTFEIHVFATSWTTGDPVAGDDAAELDWFEPQQIGDLPTTDGLPEFVARTQPTLSGL
ncbi:MAG: NUDIX hydrolase [Pseudomonadota bacterium]